MLRRPTRWLVALLTLGELATGQSPAIGGPLGQAAGRRRGARRRHLSRPIDRRRAAANVELSIVIPSKDAGKQITAILESLTNMPLATEIIVVDDGSADDTVEAVEAFRGSRRDKVYLLRNSVSKGAGRARNRAAPLLKGAFTVYVDADDAVDPHALAAAVHELRANDEADLLFFPYAIDQSGNYAMDLVSLKRFEEAKNLLLKTMPVAQRVLGECNEFTIRMRWIYAGAIYEDDGATLDDVREAVEKLEETTRTARRVLGGANPLTTGIERSLRRSRAVLAARETPSPGA